MQLTSSALQPDRLIPTQYTCEGKNISPQFSWADAPKDARSLVLILHDPDAPREGGFTHWVIYNIDPKLNQIKEDTPRLDIVVGLGVQGRNSGGKLGYIGPCPPSGTHRYIARLYALGSRLDLNPGATREEVETAMQGHVLEQADLMGIYRKRSEQAA